MQLPSMRARLQRVDLQRRYDPGFWLAKDWLGDQASAPRCAYREQSPQRVPICFRYGWTDQVIKHFYRPKQSGGWSIGFFRCRLGILHQYQHAQFDPIRNVFWNRDGVLVRDGFEFDGSHNLLQLNEPIMNALFVGIQAEVNPEKLVLVGIPAA